MPAKIRFTSSAATQLVLAKIGNPQRDEPLQTSKEVFFVSQEDQPMLTALFVKPFRNLVGHRFSHHSSLDQHEMNQLAKAIFSSEAGLLEKGCDIARRLYTKSVHPNIKSGDLCVAYIEQVEFEGQFTDAICILKSESVVPFLSINVRDGDLELQTTQGINPEKIDKGCLIINVQSDQGFYVLTFDRSGGESRFWVRDFLGLSVVNDEAYLTNAYTKMAVSFLEQESTATATEGEIKDAPPWQSHQAVKEALQFFEAREEFDLPEFEKEVLKTPETIEKFKQHREKVEQEQGQPLKKSFAISKKDLGKVKKKVGSILKFDNGVELHLKSNFLLEPSNPTIERGFDDTKGMKYVKVYYHREQGEDSAAANP